MTKALKDALKTQKKKTVKYKLPITGTLGITIGGQKRVEVPNRNSFVYVKLRDNESELIQAFNNQVAPSYGLPVIVERQGNRYVVLNVDTERYQNNWNSFAPFLPRHGNTHSFDIESGGGGDIVWIYPRQFMPALIMPSGSDAAPNVFLNAYTLKNADGSWKYIGNTGTSNIAPIYNPPTGTQAVMALVYLDAPSGNPYFVVGSGSYFPENLTGTAQIVPYIPSLTDPNHIPLAAVRLVTGTDTLSWNNIYDVRQFLHVIPTGTGGGGSATGSFDDVYLRLDTTNDPLTNTLQIIPPEDDDGLQINTIGEGQAIDVNAQGDSTPMKFVQITTGSLTNPSLQFQRVQNNVAGSLNSPFMLFDQGYTGNMGNGESPFIKLISNSTTRILIDPSAQGTGTMVMFDGDFDLDDDGTLLLLQDNGSPKWRVSARGDIEFGLGIAKESNAGKMGYGLFGDSALVIVGAGASGGDRNLKIYDNLIVDSNVQSASSRITGLLSKTVVGTDSSGNLQDATSSIVPSDGWIPVTETWTRTGNHTFTVSGDFTATYRKGTKIKYIDNSALEFGVVGSSSFSGGSGLTTVNLIVNSDYAMAATTITNTFVSYIDNPVFFPQWFNWTVSWTNLTVGTGGATTAKWRADAQLIHYQIEVVLGTSPSVGNVSFAPPVNSLSIGLRQAEGLLVMLDNGTQNYFGMIMFISTSSFNLRANTVPAGTAVANTVLSSTAPFTWVATDEIYINGWYPY